MSIVNCCKSPKPRFTVRNDGMRPLANGKRVTISLPAGTIDAVGVDRIREYVYRHHGYHAAVAVTGLGVQWQTKEGNYTKRLSHSIYKQFGEKISPHVLSEVGTIGAAHSAAVDFTIGVTRRLNGSARSLGNEDSCWWQSSSDSRCALKTNGGFGVLAFDEGGEVCGRSWVMPLKGTPLTPTFDTLTPNAFVVFNSYGVLSGYNGARLVAHMAGWTYRKIGFTCGPMYVNGAMGYLIAPEEIAINYTDGSLYLSVDRHSNLYSTERELAIAS